MKLFFTSALLLAASLVQAQNNRVSIGINTLSARDITTKLGDTEFDTLGKRINVLPSLGFYHSFKSGFGIGLELGYGRVKESSDRTYGRDNEYRDTRVGIEYDEFYICPTILESFSARRENYRFITSLSLPVSYIPTIKNYSFYTDESQNNNTKGSVTEPEGRMTKLGLFLNGGVQRRLAGGLYAGMQLGAGAIYSRYEAKGKRVSSYTFNGQETRSEIEIDDTETGLRFELRPMLSLNYYF